MRQTKSTLMQLIGSNLGDREADLYIRQHDIQQVGCGARLAANNRR